MLLKMTHFKREFVLLDIVQIEADRTIAEAMRKYKQSPEEGRMIIGKAQLLAKKNEFDEAIRELNSVRPGSKYFLNAKTEIAYMYLNIKKDKKAFTKCFEELVEIMPTNTATYIFLGDAYMKVDQPERAIDAYERALHIDPGNAHLRSKIGKSYVSTHHFAKAVQYYEDALKQDPESIELSHELAVLYLKLRRHSQAEYVLMECAEMLEKRTVLTSLMDLVQTLLLLHRVRHASDPKRTDMDNVLAQAMEIQKQILDKLRGGQQETLLLQKQIAAGICFNLGKNNLERREIEHAISYFEKALSYDETHEPSMLSLARIFLNRNDPQSCSKHCRNLLRVNPSHEEANIMMTDLMFREDNLEEAIQYFERQQVRPNDI